MVAYSVLPIMDSVLTGHVLYSKIVVDDVAFEPARKRTPALNIGDIV